MTEKDTLKWNKTEIITFLGVYRKYKALWDTNSNSYKRKRTRDDAFNRLCHDLNKLGFVFTEENLKRKIKSLKSAYRLEESKVKKSMKHSGDAIDVYKPKLVWFKEADSFLSNLISDSESNQDLSHRQESSEQYSNNNEQSQPLLCDAEDQSSSLSSSLVAQNIYKKKKTKDSVESLKKISKASSSFVESDSEDTAQQQECNNFALLLEAQLRKLPLRSYVILQEKIQSLITQERLRTMTS